MEVRFIDRGAVKLAGFAINTNSRNGENFRDIPLFWGTCANSGRLEKLHCEAFVKRHDEFGVCFPEGADGRFDYFVGVEVKDRVAVPQDYHTREIPAAFYAVFTTPPAAAADFPGSIQRTWREIFGRWFPESGRVPDQNGPSFELYDERGMRENGRQCEIWIPVIREILS